MKILALALAASFSLATIAPASATFKLSNPAPIGIETVEVGSHSHGGYEHGHKRVYKKYHKPRKHRHYHCHKRLVYGYWKKVCHKAWHNRHGGHHGHYYH